MLAGAGDWRATALLAPPSSRRPDVKANGDRTGEEIVRRFRAGASSTAFRMACYFSVTWLNLPVMRLVQHVMLPSSDLSHLAEVLLGGLLYREGDGRGGTDVDQYEFLPGVREELNSYLLRDDLIKVLHHSSEFVAERFGQSFDFAALLADPEGADLSALVGPNSGQPFAVVAAGVLSRLGGRYKALAERLTAAAEGQPGHQGTEPTVEPAPRPSFSDEALPPMILFSPVCNVLDSRDGRLAISVQQNAMVVRWARVSVPPDTLRSIWYVALIPASQNCRRKICGSLRQHLPKLSSPRCRSSLRSSHTVFVRPRKSHLLNASDMLLAGIYGRSRTWLLRPA